MNFAAYARDHQKHHHCCGCGGCLLDPAIRDLAMGPYWCVGCMTRVKNGLPAGVNPPWLVEFVK